MDKKPRLNIYITEDLKVKAQEKAKEMGMSMSALFMFALKEYLKQDSVVTMAEMYKALLEAQVKQK